MPYTHSGHSSIGKSIGKHYGKGAKRHSHQQKKDPLLGVTKPAVRRLCRRGGVKRISNLIYEETRGITKAFVENVLHDALAYAEHARRRTVSAIDIVYALKRQKMTLYGFGV